MNLKINPEKQKIIISLIIIIFFSAIAYFLLILISPESKALSKLLIGFGIASAVIVLIALYIKYTAKLYEEIIDVEERPSRKLDLEEE